jgi:hypothetical protein
MRKIKLIRVKRKTTIPRRLIRKAVLEAYGIDPASLKKKPSGKKKKKTVSKLAAKKKTK